MKKDKAHFIAFVGVMAALIFVLFILESTLLAGVGVTACILSLPVSIALSIYDDWHKSFLGGTLLGFASCLFCLILPSFVFYANPLISVLPRMFIGVTAYWTYFGLSRLFGKCKNKFIKEKLPAAIAGVVGSVTNTVLYISAVNIWTGNALGIFSQLFEVAIAIYFPIELAACFILVPIYVMVLQKIGKKIAPKKAANSTAQNDFVAEATLNSAHSADSEGVK